MSINVIAESITLERCKELFLYALSGSDYTSRFFRIRKVKFWNSWLVNQDVPERCIRLGDCPSLPLREGDINVMERLIISLCYDDSNCFSIDLARYKIFKYRENMEIQSYRRQKILLFSIYISQLMFLVIYWVDQIYTTRLMSHR